MVASKNDTNTPDIRWEDYEFLLYNILGKKSILIGQSILVLTVFDQIDGGRNNVFSTTNCNFWGMKR